MNQYRDDQYDVEARMVGDGYMSQLSISERGGMCKLISVSSGREVLETALSKYDISNEKALVIHDLAKLGGAVRYYSQENRLTVQFDL